MQRIGLFGGTFDPIHLGHLLVAQTAREELALSRIFFIPAAQSPFKPDRKSAAAKDRLLMLRLALAGDTSCEIDEQEIGRGGVSYTIDTVRTYLEKFPGSEIFYLIGADHVPSLPKWREAGELARVVQFAVIPRPGQNEVEFPAPFRGRTLKGFPTGISSSEIRARVQAGLPIHRLVPPFVDEAIKNYRLYL